MTQSRQILARWGETHAAAYLRQRGYTILESNVHTPYGEIDLVAQQGSTVVFVEVKTRSTLEFGAPEASITPARQARLLANAEYYIQQHPEASAQWRIDVIAIQRLKPQASPKLVHFENAVS